MKSEISTYKMRHNSQASEIVVLKRKNTMELRKEPSTEPEAPPDQLGDLLTLLRNIKEKQKTNSRALLEK